MNTTANDSLSAKQIVVTLESDATVSEIRRALLLIRGVASVRVARNCDHSLTPALRSRIRKARNESINGETVVCKSPEEMLQYFDSL